MRTGLLYSIAAAVVMCVSTHSVMAGIGEVGGLGQVGSLGGGNPQVPAEEPLGIGEGIAPPVQGDAGAAAPQGIQSVAPLGTEPVAPLGQKQVTKAEKKVLPPVLSGIPNLTITYGQKPSYYGRFLKQVIADAEATKGVTYDVVSTVPARIMHSPRSAQMMLKFNEYMNTIVVNMTQLGVPLARIRRNTQYHEDSTTQEISIYVRPPKQ